MSANQQSENGPQEKKLLDPEKSIINVSLQKPVKNYVFIAKLILKKFGNL